MLPIPLAFLLLAAAPAYLKDALQDRSGDGTTNYLNAKFYAADSPSVADLRAAANPAACLAFEKTSLDLPLRMALSRYSSGETSVRDCRGRRGSALHRGSFRKNL